MRACIAATALFMLAACSQPAPAFTVAGATVDATHWCPGGATNAAYDLHAKIDVRNATARPVTIGSATASMTLEKVTGAWLEPVGDVYDAGEVAVAPASVGPSSTARLDVKIPSSCTSGRYGSGTSSAGEYRVTLRLMTSVGAFAVTAANRHEILAA